MFWIGSHEFISFINVSGEILHSTPGYWQLLHIFSNSEEEN